MKRALPNAITMVSTRTYTRARTPTNARVRTHALWAYAHTDAHFGRAWRGKKCPQNFKVFKGFRVIFRGDSGVHCQGAATGTMHAAQLITHTQHTHTRAVEWSVGERFLPSIIRVGQDRSPTWAGFSVPKKQKNEKSNLGGRGRPEAAGRARHDE